MLSALARPVGAALRRSFSTSAQNNAKVAVLGASGGIGQPLSLLLKNSPLVSRLTLYDIAHTPGVAADLSHIETRANVKGYLGPEQLPDCLKGCDVVVIPAGVPRKPVLFCSVQRDRVHLFLYTLAVGEKRPGEEPRHWQNHSF
ncbi:malate dehydrogenase, mitochondrial, isoform CRA_b [Rattus norvegicus]|uniref:Malate dehydrogenase, mitochondrial n=1 Tax=Rattus norvegicus TaxID=10116 RepID=A6J0B3_RAT|nr:malate dehydrogenase, mitochondrial, isoform CRA_b [Rattus norvegicus]